MVGHVAHVTERDSLPLAGHWVVLHEVTPAGGGAVDSARTDRAGRYRLQAAGQDTTAGFLVSASFGGIAYFSEPLRFPAVRVDTAPALAVYDTSSTSPTIALAQRLLVVRDREPDGSRRVIELLILANAGRETRIAPDTTRPVWFGRLPQGALQFEVGDSDMSERAVLRHGDTVLVVAPIPPGERQLLVSYVLPGSARELVIPFDHAVQRVNVMLEDTTATIEGAALTLRGFDELENLIVRRFGGENLPAGSTVVVRFGRQPLSLPALWWTLVPLAALAMAWAFLRWWRRSASPRPSPAEANDVEILAAQIAALDAEFAQHASDEYRRRRAELKERLAATLARGGTRA